MIGMKRGDVGVSMHAKRCALGYRDCRVVGTGCGQRSPRLVDRNLPPVRWTTRVQVAHSPLDNPGEGLPIAESAPTTTWMLSCTQV